MSKSQFPELFFNEKFFILIIRLFGGILKQNKYLIRKLNFNDRDDDYVMFESYRNHDQIYFNISPGGLISKKERTFDIYFLRQKKILGLFSIEELGKSNHLDDMFILFPVYKDLPRIITDENIWDVLNLYLNFIEQEMMPYIKGEVWFNRKCK